MLLKTIKVQETVWNVDLDSRVRFGNAGVEAIQHSDGVIILISEYRNLIFTDITANQCEYVCKYCYEYWSKHKRLGLSTWVCPGKVHCVPIKFNFKVD